MVPLRTLFANRRVIDPGEVPVNLLVAKTETERPQHDSEHDLCDGRCPVTDMHGGQRLDRDALISSCENLNPLGIRVAVRNEQKWFEPNHLQAGSPTTEERHPARKSQSQYACI